MPMDSEDRKFMDINKKRWNELVDAHTEGSTYDIDGFKAGNSTINGPEKELLGDLSGKKVLHLQCHFGMDTISLLREGAEEVVGVDYSERAVEVANNLRDELRVNARFVHSNVLELDQVFDEHGSFDVVFTSYGTIVWLSDLEAWARVINTFLRPGGKFVIVDSHPLSHIFDDESPEPKLVHRYRYFSSKIPDLYEVEGSYASSKEIENKTEYIWTHPISEIINCLIQNRLVIRGFFEYPRVNWKMFPFLVKQEDGWYHFPNEFAGKEIPLLFGVTAIKSKL
jgi:SAM-dependent methyltransferase